MDINQPSILEIFRQAIKGGGDRLGQQLQDGYRASWPQQVGTQREMSPHKDPGWAPYSPRAPINPPWADVSERINLGSRLGDLNEDVFQGRITPKEGYMQGEPYRTELASPMMDMRGSGIAAQFAPQGARPNGFPGVDDMQRHRGTGYTVPDAARRHIMGAHDAGRDYGYEGSDPYPPDVVDRVLIEEQMRRRNRTMPGSPVNY